LIGSGERKLTTVLNEKLEAKHWVSLLWCGKKKLIILAVLRNWGKRRSGAPLGGPGNKYPSYLPGTRVRSPVSQLGKRAMAAYSLRAGVGEKGLAGLEENWGFPPSRSRKQAKGRNSMALVPSGRRPLGSTDDRGEKYRLSGKGTLQRPQKAGRREKEGGYSCKRPDLVL